MNTQETRIQRVIREHPVMLSLVGIAALLFIVGGSIYLYTAGKRVYIEKSDIEAPSIDLSPTSAGTLEAIYVNEGDIVPANSVVARVGLETIKTKTAGLITEVHDKVGALITPNEAVVTMIDPKQLRVVGTIDEDKGLADIHVGEHALFTVDAFGGKQYEGVVDEVSPTSRASGIAFSISDKRETRQFDVKVRYDVNQYPELKNGMSAKLWIRKDSAQ